jgi:hypothetical protein
MISDFPELPEPLAAIGFLLIMLMLFATLVGDWQ